MLKSAIILLLPLVWANGAPGLEQQPYSIDWKDNTGSPVSVSFLLDAPAGKDGHIGVMNGHLAKPNGQRFRIWGVNCSFSGNAPTKELAPVYADHLARFGVNCVRVHHFDRPAPRGLLDTSKGTTRQLDAEILDRFDFFVFELKKRGIYIDLNLNVSRPFMDGDGVKDAGKVGYGKALTYFDPRLIELQQEYARLLLTHRNRYTGNEYRYEPAVAIVEMVNENSLIESWLRGRLLGKQTEPTRETWTDIPPSYEQDLTRLFNEYAERKAPPSLIAEIRRTSGIGSNAPVPRLKPDEFATAKDERFALEAAFYMDLEDRFFQTMRRYLKEELGVKSLLIGTSAHSGSMSPYPLISSTSKLDIVDGHTYWQHPRYTQGTGSNRTGFTIENTAMVNDPLQSTIITLSRNAVAGKPYIVSEVNHPWPSEYAAEGIPILASYGAFHNWDGIFWYSFSHVPPEEWKASSPGHFDIRQDPVKMSQLAAGALTFLRADVSAASKTVERTYSRIEVIETLRMPKTEAPYFTIGFPPHLPLEHGTRIASLDGTPSDPVSLSDPSPIVSDTGELSWYHLPPGQGLVTVDTGRNQSLIGYIKANGRGLKNLSAIVENDFCAITLATLDGKPIASSSRMLLTAGSKTGTTGMVWDDKHSTLLAEGTGPITIEAVVADISLTGLDAAREVVATPLNGAGKPQGNPVAGKQTGAKWTFRIGTTAAPWYLVEVNR